ncbi:MAG: hypothetical protein J5717_00095 [Lachnospiraceae bacterium]|nr:hypothetical protein [Lachnospiraceae bacterium]
MSGVFLKILNMSITASWLIAAVILVRLLLKKAPKWVTCLLWAVVAVRLICPFSIESALSLVPTDAPVPANILVASRPTVATGVPVIDNTINPAISETMAPQVGDSVNPLQVATFVATIVWVVGASVLLAYALISWLRLRRKVAASIEIKKGVRAGDDVDSPFILGVFKPIVYVPASMSGETLESVLRHESAHLARKDHWWKPLGFLLLTVYWFNPLCWAAYILLCRDIELACDEKVIRDMDTADKAAYSQALLDCSVNRARVAACPLAFGEVGVKERVKSVLNYKKPTFWVIVCAVVACVVVAVCFLTNRKSDEPEESVTEEVKVEEVGQEPIAEESVGSGFISHLVDVSYDPNATNHMDEGAHYIFEIDNDGESRKLGYLFAEYEELEGLDRSSEEAYCRSFAEKYAPELLPFYDSATKTAEDEVYIVEMVTDKCIVGLITYADCDFMRVKIEPLDAPFYDQLSELPGAVYVWEKEGFGSPFYITLNSDGTFQYYVGAFSSHIGMGRWNKDDSVLTLTEDEKQTGYGATFTFEIQDDNLIFVQKKSAAFGGVTVEDGDKFKRFNSSTEASGEESFRWAYPFYEWPLDEGETEKVLNACNFDITHDGKKDTIILTSIEPEAVGGVDRSPGDWGQVKVYDGSVTAGDGSTPFWGLDWATAHTGNIQCFETTVDGLDYIVVTSLWVGQGFGDYMYDVLYWDNGAACVVDTKEYSFELDKEYDLTDFYDSLYNWINSKSVLIVASDCDIYPHVMYSSDGNTVNPDEFYSRRKKLYD